MADVKEKRFQDIEHTITRDQSLPDDGYSLYNSEDLQIEQMAAGYDHKNFRLAIFTFLTFLVLLVAGVWLSFHFGNIFGGVYGPVGQEVLGVRENLYQD